MGSEAPCRGEVGLPNKVPSHPLCSCVGLLAESHQGDVDIVRTSEPLQSLDKAPDEFALPAKASSLPGSNDVDG